MKNLAKMAVPLALVACIAFASFALADEKTIVLPQGTKAQKLGEGHFKFRLPDGKVVEVRNLVLPGKVLGNTGTRAIVGDSGIYDASGKKISAGWKGSLAGGPKPALSAKKPPKKGVAEIDDEVTWAKIDDEVTWGMKLGDSVVFLPATLRFQEIKIIDPSPPDAPVKKMPGGMRFNPQPEPPGPSSPARQ